MKYRSLGKTGFNVSEVSFGAWAIGGTWGKVDDSESMAALHTAIDNGVNFIDTADVYGDGHSERLIAQLCAERSEEIYVATKAGRRLDPHLPAGYNRENLTSFVERSLKNLKRETLDLLQLHCPPTEVYYMPEIFAILDDLVVAGKIKFYGVSVEKVAEALKAIEYPGVQTVQIIFNLLRQRPAELFFIEAKKRKVGILARVPLASGLLSGKMNREYNFEKDDHRRFNREGAAFDKGETFSGIDYETGLKVVDKLKEICPSGSTMPQLALRWILMFDAVSCVIPGAKISAQVKDNITASGMIPLSDELMKKIKLIYNQDVKRLVHQYW
jgi:aryl-alcohol dehydrogenase-like predicted oxidoreductase